MTEFVELEQGSEEWFAWRDGKLTASIAAAVMDEGKWFPKNRRDLADYLSGRKKSEGNVATTFGSNMEAAARDQYNTERVVNCIPMCVSDGPYAASLDGWDDVNKHLLELKCPYTGTESQTWKEAKSHSVEIHIYWQMVQQIGITQPKAADLAVWVDGELTIIDIDIKGALKDWDVLKRAWGDFLAEWDPATPFLENTSEEAAEAAEFYKVAKHALDTSKALEAEARKQLLAIADGSSMTVGNLSVTYYDRKGNVQYDKVTELDGVDLDQYRGKTGRSARVTVK